MSPRSGPNDPDPALALWRMLLKTTFGMRHAIRPVLEGHGLTGPQWRVLNLLSEAGTDGLTPGQISDGLIHTHGNTTGLLDKLEEAGFVQRSPHPDDRRALLIHLTDHGQVVHREVAPLFSKRVADLMSCLTPTQQSEMLAALESLLQQARATAAAEGPAAGEVVKKSCG